MVFTFYFLCFNAFLYNKKKSFLLIFSLITFFAWGDRQAFNDYWYANGAEINRFKLKQIRYGEIRQGEMTLVFVTEPFNTIKHVKSDDPKAKSAAPILKLNFTRNFNTGIYPYSTMLSVFTEIAKPIIPLKIAFTCQEWCGTVFHQLNQRKDRWDSTHYSYFEAQGDKQIKLKKYLSEDGILNLIRIDPKHLPTGDLNVIPSLLFIRLFNGKIKSYTAKGQSFKGKYLLSYPDLKREITIYYQPNFPYRITGWKEVRYKGAGATQKKLITSANISSVKMSPYWEKNKNIDEKLRIEMGYPIYQ